MTERGTPGACDHGAVKEGCAYKRWGSDCKAHLRLRGHQPSNRGGCVLHFGRGLDGQWGHVRCITVRANQTAGWAARGAEGRLLVYGNLHHNGGSRL